MSYNRKIVDKTKPRNFVAKNDFNRGGYHGKDHKAKRSHLHDTLSRIDLDNMDDDNYLEELYED